MSRAPRVAFFVGVVCLAVAVLSLPAAASSMATGDLSTGTHGNHVTVDPQVSADGSVVVETVSVVSPGFVVLAADDGGEPGAVVGHAAIDEISFQTAVPVSVSADTWREWSGSRRLWAVLYSDTDGDGEFDPETDRSMVGRGPGTGFETARTSFTLGKDTAATRVLARQFDPLPVRDGRVTVGRVDLSTGGFVVAKPVGGDAVVGTRSLDAGTHRNVSLSLSPSFLDDQSDRFRLELLAYRDDGDGTFDDGDRPVRAGSDTVGTEVVVSQDRAGATTQPLVVTPSSTADAGATDSASGTETPENGTVELTVGTETVDADDSSSPPLTVMFFVAGVGAVAGFLLTRRWKRRRRG